MTFLVFKGLKEKDSNTHWIWIVLLFKQITLLHPHNKILQILDTWANKNKNLKSSHTSKRVGGQERSN